ncbi:M48 family metallopeptidase [Thiomicrorhabdus sp. 6S3-12]|uniref:M48 family metallopeptidase n=1 Tax=Thiomicrorhabdus sp. 6S3-12 TaxID=2819681 RepID=UPI001AAC72DB|nr:M48 family metallopeptidase [Thiomicrorhabdus sp. 6S3-12]MBO1923699.1 M48 family metallopeptidase [Thiomicrorhabdus sp. 6S3-12]
MDFFGAQDQARSRTRWLVFWYVMILLFISVLSSLVLMLLIPLFTGAHAIRLDSQYLAGSVYTLDNWPILLGMSGFIFFGAALSSYLKGRELSKGGEAVAVQLGARLVPQNSQHPLQRRALNIVQEMAIAANMPVPQLYLLPEETSINAFAAGLYPSDAVITVTRGALERLNRDQLQGVIGHEFSHILNGDMRLNLRLIMLLHGIEFIGSVGRFLSPGRRRYHSSRRSNRSGGVIVLVGLLLRFLGWFGEIFSRLLQAGISRQREFLADASSLQFTRNPDGIGGALKVLAHAQGRSYLRADNLEEVAHLFFAQALFKRFHWYATHPPLEERLQRIYPNWNGETLEGLPLHETNTHFDAEQSDDDSSSAAAKALTGNPLTDLQLESVQNLALLLPLLTQNGKEPGTSQKAQLEALLASLNEPLDAMALVFAVLLARQYGALHDKAYSAPSLVAEFAAQLNAENKQHWRSIDGLDSLVIQQLQRLQSLGQINRLLLIELGMPALKVLSEVQYRQFAELLDETVAFDRKVTLFETALLGLINHYLQANLGLKQVARSRIRRWRIVQPELQLLFSYMSRRIALSAVPENDYRHALSLLGIHDIEAIPLIPTEQLDEQQVQRAVNRLQQLDWTLKGELLKAMVALVEKDGVLTEAEEELILAIALNLEAPLPRFTLQTTLEQRPSSSH